MPNFPIVDAHVHLYDPARIAYPWLASVPAIDGAFLPADFDAARGPVAVESLVFVEVDAAPGRELDEARFVAELAEEDARIGAIVASAPVERGAAVAEDLERLRTLPRVTGVRRLIQGHADPAYCLAPDFVAGVREVGRAGFTFDLCIRHWQLASATELVRRCPDVSFVLDHIAKPPIAEGGREPWRTEMRAIAELPNVVLKVSGVVTEADPEAWTVEDIRPYVEHSLDCFGFARCLFGSDWPVVNLAASYTRWIEVLDECLAGVPEAELRRFYRDNAIRTYSIGAA
ncbi:amidohydrolase [Aureimonas endophytica]|uniref:Amidohydrolase n=1 Tax=Aureimonas endophytica TaxID=2027858 RepID=A0A916ZMA7_9HYPH|nr:amidohydrolase family protein [Aureimonas endophytica]GGE04106.1 amidohydrolase [Aureimonas endophytica]